MSENPFNIPEFREEMGKLLDEKLLPLTDKVEEHDKAINRAEGALAILGVVWTAIVGGAEWFFHRGR